MHALTISLQNLDYQSFSVADNEFDDIYLFNLEHQFLQSPRQLYFVLTNNNNHAIQLYDIESEIDACFCLIAQVAIGFNSLHRTQQVIRNYRNWHSFEDLKNHFKSSGKYSRCKCLEKGINFASPVNIELLGGMHSIFIITPKSLTKTKSLPHRYPFTLRDSASNYSNQFNESFHVQIVSFVLKLMNQQLTIGLSYRPWQYKIQFKCAQFGIPCNNYILGSYPISEYIVQTTLPVGYSPQLNASKLLQFTLHPKHLIQNIESSGFDFSLDATNITQNNIVSMQYSAKLRLMIPSIECKQRNQSDNMSKDDNFVSNPMLRFLQCNMYHALFKLLEEYPETTLSASVPDQLREKLTNLEQKVFDPVEQILHYDLLFTEWEDFNDLMEPYLLHSSQLALTSTKLQVTGESIQHNFLLGMPRISLPIINLPNSYEVFVSCHISRIHLVYLEILNPFEIEIAVKILSNQLKANLKLLRILPQQNKETPNLQYQQLNNLKLQFNESESIEHLSMCDHLSRTCNQNTNLRLLSQVRMKTLFNIGQLPTKNLFSAFSMHSVSNNQHLPNNLSALIRFPQAEWIIAPHSSQIIGPVEVITSSAQSATTFKGYLFNSFTGFSPVSFVVQNHQPRFVTQHLYRCVYNRDVSLNVHSNHVCETTNHIHNTHLLNDTQSIVLNITSMHVQSRQQSKINSQFFYRLSLLNEGSAALVTNIRFGKLECDRLNFLQELFISAFELQLFSELCRQLPLRIPSLSELNISLVADEILLYKSLNLQLQLLETLHDQQIPYQYPVLSLYLNFSFDQPNESTSQLSSWQFLFPSFCLLVLLLISLQLLRANEKETVLQNYPITSQKISFPIKVDGVPLIPIIRYKKVFLKNDTGLLFSPTTMKRSNFQSFFSCQLESETLTVLQRMPANQITGGTIHNDIYQPNSVEDDQNNDKLQTKSSPKTQIETKLSPEQLQYFNLEKKQKFNDRQNSSDKKKRKKKTLQIIDNSTSSNVYPSTISLSDIALQASISTENPSIVFPPPGLHPPSPHHHQHLLTDTTNSNTLLPPPSPHRPLTDTTISNGFIFFPEANQVSEQKVLRSLFEEMNDDSPVFNYTGQLLTNDFSDEVIPESSSKPFWPYSYHLSSSLGLQSDNEISHLIHSNNSNESMLSTSLYQTEIHLNDYPKSDILDNRVISSFSLDSGPLSSLVRSEDIAWQRLNHVSPPQQIVPLTQVHTTKIASEEFFGPGKFFDLNSFNDGEELE
jgi:hypothetical protein